MTTTSYNIKLLSLNRFSFFCVFLFAVLPLKKGGGPSFHTIVYITLTTITHNYYYKQYSSTLISAKYTSIPASS